MSSPKALRKAKLTITISEDIASDINKFVKEKGFPRSQVMEEMLREWIKEFKRKEIEKGIETYYQSLDKEEKVEDKEWASMSSENAKRTWND